MGSSYPNITAIQDPAVLLRTLQENEARAAAAAETTATAVAASEDTKRATLKTEIEADIQTETAALKEWVKTFIGDQKYTETITTPALTNAITHNLKSEDVILIVGDEDSTAAGRRYTIDSANQVTLYYSTAPASAIKVFVRK